MRDIGKTQINVVLAARQYLYKLLQRIFSDAPSIELLKHATSEHTSTTLKLLQLGVGATAEPDISVANYLILSRDIRQKLLGSGPETLRQLNNEYTLLFIGPQQLPAPLWESVYLSREKLLFQESTLQVRQIYQKHNFIPNNFLSAPDDHLAIELDFMAHLAGQTFECHRQHQFSIADALLQEQKDFLDQHLGLWMADFYSLIQTSPAQLFYPKAAGLANSFIQNDRALLTKYQNTC